MRLHHPEALSGALVDLGTGSWRHRLSSLGRVSTSSSKSSQLTSMLPRSSSQPGNGSQLAPALQLERNEPVSALVPGGDSLPVAGCRSATKVRLDLCLRPNPRVSESVLEWETKPTRLCATSIPIDGSRRRTELS